MLTCDLATVSYSRACSTLNVEAQTCLDLVRNLVWAQAMLCEALYPSFTNRAWEQFLHLRGSCAMVGCKSLYGRFSKSGAPADVDGKLAALDIAVIKGHLLDAGVTLRWVPSKHQLGDSLTKGNAEAVDFLRSIMRSGRYVLNREGDVLEMKRAEKQTSS